MIFYSLLSLLSLLCQVCHGAEADDTPDPFTVKAIAYEKYDAFVNVFIDSTHPAPLEDIQFIMMIMDEFADDYDNFLAVLSEFYALECRRAVPFVLLDIYQTCPLSMNTHHDFSMLTSKLRVEQASSFFLLPPGKLRNDVRVALLKCDDYIPWLLRNLSCYSEAEFPYPEYLNQVKDLLTEEAILAGLKGRVSDSHLWPKRSHDQYLQSRVGKKKSSTCLLAAVLPAESYKLMYELIDGKWTFLNETGAICCVNDRDILLFEMSRLSSINTISSSIDGDNENGHVMEALNGYIYELVQRTTIPNLKLMSTKEAVSDKQSLFAAVVEAVLWLNPCALLHCPQAIVELPNIKNVMPLIATTILRKLVQDVVHDGVVYCDDHGSVVNLVKELSTMVQSEWERNFIVNVLTSSQRRHGTLSLASIQRLKIDSYSTALSTKSLDSDYTVTLTSDIMNFLPPIECAVLRSCLMTGKFFCNPVVFMDLLCTISDRIKFWSKFVNKLQRGHYDSIPAKSLFLINSLLKMTFSPADLDLVHLNKSAIGPHRPAVKGFEKAIELTRTTRFMIHSLIFRCGSFAVCKSPSTSPSQSAVSNDTMEDLFEAYEEMAKLVFPNVVEQLRSVRDGGDKEWKSIEYLFMCPYVDTEWVLEAYASMNLPAEHPTSIHRLLNIGSEPANLLKKYIEGAIEKSNTKFTNYDNIRLWIAKLLLNLHRNHHTDTVLWLLESRKDHHDDILKALEGQKCGIKDVLSSYLNGFQDCTEDVFDSLRNGDFLNLLPPQELVRMSTQKLLGLPTLFVSDLKFYHEKLVRKEEYLAQLALSVITKIYDNSQQTKDDKKKQSGYKKQSLAVDVVKLILKITDHDLVIRFLNKACSICKEYSILKSCLPIFFDSFDKFVDFTSNPRVHYLFKLLMAGMSMTVAGHEKHKLKTMLNLMLHIMATGKTLSEAARVIMEDVQRCIKVKMSEQDVFAILAANVYIQHVNMFQFCPRNLTMNAHNMVMVMVDDEIMNIPQQSTFAHFYAIFKHHKRIRKPFKLVNKHSGKVIEFCDDKTVDQLVGSQFYHEYVQSMAHFLQREQQLTTASNVQLSNLDSNSSSH